MIALLLMGGIREVLGYGTFLGVPLFGPHYEPWVIMILPPGGFLTLAVILLAVSLNDRRRKRRAEAAAADATRRAA
jgi:electron transport complex protein RnfE